MSVKQIEIFWRGEAFALVPEQTQDDERINREQQQSESDRAESDKNQTELF